jgi:hypothetical protein
MKKGASGARAAGPYPSPHAGCCPLVHGGFGRRGAFYGGDRYCAVEILRLTHPVGGSQVPVLLVV